MCAATWFPNRSDFQPEIFLKCSRNLRGLYFQLNEKEDKWEQLWKNWLDKNRVEPSEVKSLINESIWFNGKDNYRLMQFGLWNQLSDEEWIKAKETFDNVMKNYAILSPTLILRFFDTLVTLIRIGAWHKTAQEILNEFKTYIDQLGDKLNLSFSDERSILGNKDIEEEIQLKEYLLEKLRSRTKEFQQTWANDILSKDIEEFADSLKQIDPNDNNQTLMYFDIKRFITIYSNAEYLTTGKIRGFLEQRYQISSTYKWLIQEKKFLENLKTEIEKIFNDNAKPLPPSIFRLYYLKMTIEKCLGELEKIEQ
jgi:hypothetical protein